MKTKLLKIYIMFGVAALLQASEASEKISEERIKEFEKQIRRISTPRHINIGDVPSGRTASAAILALVAQFEMPKEVYIAEVEKVADEFTTVKTTTNGKMFLSGGDSWYKLISAIGDLGEQDFLPWLEQKTEFGEWPGLRERAAVSYVKIAGLDATPFVQKILSGIEEKYDIGCKRVVAKEFFEQVAKAESEKAPQAKIDAAYKMLVEQAQTVAYVGHADEIDKFLCERLQGYRASIQREKIVERFVDSENEIARANFGKKRDEIQKTPKAERTDLSKRFPGLAEVKLEDEQQTEATSPAEVK